MSFLTLDRARNRTAAAGTTRTGKLAQELPSVNLLPAQNMEKLAVRRVRHRLVAAGLVGALAVGAGWLVQTQRLNEAKDRLAAEEALAPPLQAQVAALAPVAAFYDLLEARKRTASGAMAAEVLFSEALVDLAGRTPADVEITTMSVALTATTVTAVAPPVSPLEEAGIDAQGRDLTRTQTGSAAGAGTGSEASAGGAAAGGQGQAAGAAASAATPALPPPAQAVSCARPDPFNPAPIIGCVTLSGTATSRAAVGELVQSLRRADLYADPFVTTTTFSGAEGEEIVAFSGSVGLTGKAVSGRYADLSWLTDPKVLREAERMIAEGNTASRRLAQQAAAAAAAARAKAEAEALAAAEAEAKAQRRAERQLARQLEAAAAAAALAAQQAAQKAAEDALPGNGGGE